MKTSLGIWAFGGMATRFNPGGYKPELAGSPTAVKVRTAVEGLGDLIDDYEFHYPQELAPANLGEVRAALDGHGIYCVCSGLHLDARFGRGGFCSPDDSTRAEALRLTREGIDLAAEVGRASSSGLGSRATTIRSRRLTKSRGHASSTASAKAHNTRASAASRCSWSTRTRSRR